MFYLSLSCNPVFLPNDLLIKALCNFVWIYETSSTLYSIFIFSYFVISLGRYMLWVLSQRQSSSNCGFTSLRMLDYISKVFSQNSCFPLDKTQKPSCLSGIKESGPNRGMLPTCRTSMQYTHIFRGPTETFTNKGQCRRRVFEGAVVESRNFAPFACAIHLVPAAVLGT